MADSAEDLQTSDDVAMEVNNEPSNPDIAQAEINELMADDDVVVLMEGSNDEMELHEEKESKTEEVNGDNEAKGNEDEADRKNNENETEEYLDVSVENAFEADVLDETVGDDEEGKENHEGDGEHEEMKDEEEEEEEEEEDDPYAVSNQDPNVMPQVNVSVLAQRKWQVKIYPLKPSDFVNGQISRVFKHARESLLYLLSPGKNARGKGEMYISSANQAVRCVHSLMRLEYFHPEVNVEIIKKNDEGAIEEKAYLRFDSKLTQILTMRPFRRAQSGRKRDRLIGSVFVKNLPPGTTKDTLRVMFPFAQEINYNPEKFKDCTARLVLHYRSHVIPCLKAFAKAELGGNVLELHPLTKRKRTRTDDEMEGTDVKQKRRSEEPKKEDTHKKAEEAKSETQGSEGERKETAKKDAPRESREKSEAKSAEDKGKKEDKNKERKDNKPSQSRRHRRPLNRPGNQKKAQEPRTDNKPYRPTLVGGKERGGPVFGGGRGGSQGGKAPPRNNKGRQDRPQTSSPRNYRETERSREFKTAARRFANNRNSRSRGSSGGGPGGSGRQNQGSMGRSSYGVGSGLGMGATMTASDANLAINAEATKEMVLLQNQLSMAIKNQLAMLNQTTMAVEHAKRGASSIGLGSEIQSSIPSRSPKGLGAGPSSSRRSVDQYRPAASAQDNLDRYDRRGQNRNKSSRRGGGGGANSGYNKRIGAAAYRDEEEDWGRDMTASQYTDPYRQPTDYVYDREYSGYGASARSYNQDSGYSGYF